IQAWATEESPHVPSGGGPRTALKNFSLSKRSQSKKKKKLALTEKKNAAVAMRRCNSSMPRTHLVASKQESVRPANSAKTIVTLHPKGHCLTTDGNTMSARAERRN